MPRLNPRALGALLLVLCFILPVNPPPANAQSALLRWAYVIPEDSQSVDSARRNASQLSFVSPKAFVVNADGSLSGTVSPTVSALARTGAAKLLPMVQNGPRYGDFTPVLRDSGVRARAISGLVAAVRDCGCDGLNIDFEALQAEDRDSLTDFMRVLASELRPSGKLVTIAVSSRVTDPPSGWNAPYDYVALGQISDYVVIMAYAFSTPNSATPGSFSPISDVERAATYARERIEPRKLLLGLGLWGYDWNVSKKTVGIRKYPETMALRAKRGGELGYSAQAQSAWLKYNDEAGSRHEVWFEDYQSVTAKTNAAERLGLGGVAFWRLGHEDPAIWGEPRPLPTGKADYALSSGWFFSQTGGGNGAGYSVTDGGEDGARFWTSFRQLGGVDTLGYPLSRRYVGTDGFTYQAFQRGLLQWRPDIGTAWLANTFDQLSAAGKDDALLTVGIPAPVLDDGSGGNWSLARATRLLWLTDVLVHRRFQSNPGSLKGWNIDGAIQLYGLPSSRPEKSGPFIVQRFQRVALQLWVEDVPGMPPKGSVVGILGGELLKQHGLIPSDALQVESP